MILKIPRIMLALFLVLSIPSMIVSCGGSGGSSSENGDDNGGSDDGGGDGETSHHAGRDCGQSGCHDSSIESDKRFVYSGTVYSGANGSAISGKVVVITETATGNVVRTTSDASGNFYTLRGTRGSAYSATIEGNTLGMISQATNGSCNSCHNGTITAKVYVN